MENCSAETTASSTGRLRSKKRVNYREADDVRLSRAERARSPSNELFPVHVIERTDERVKVHYVGYSSSYDEWRDESELESIDVNEPAESHEDSMCGECSYEPFSLYKHLVLKIKQSLSCSRRSSPAVRIVVPFYTIHFNGGLKLLGTPSTKYKGCNAVQ